MDRLVASDILTPTAVEGVQARSACFEEIVDALNAMAGRTGKSDGAEKLYFPPAMVRTDLARGGYLGSFPNLLGTIHCFCGDERAHRTLLTCVAEGKEWATQQEPTDLALAPAACYPLYPLIARRGKLPPQGGLFDVFSWCFRREPSPDPARMQCFRMREYVCIGSEEQVLEFRQRWLDRAQQFANDLHLPHKVDLANDPFFGRSGRLMADSQREQRLKYELLIPISRDDRPTACMSFNYHLDHFSEPWGIRQADGTLAVSACVGFGLERTTLALFRHHGLDPARWPSGVRRALWG